MMSHLLSCCAPTPCASARELVSLERAFRVVGERVASALWAPTPAVQPTPIAGGKAAGAVRSAVASGRLLRRRKVCIGDCVESEMCGHDFNGSFLTDYGIICW